MKEVVPGVLLQFEDDGELRDKLRLIVPATLRLLGMQQTDKVTYRLVGGG